MLYIKKENWEDLNDIMHIEKRIKLDICKSKTLTLKLCS